MRSHARFSTLGLKDLAGADRDHRREFLPARARLAVGISESEFAFAQIEHRDVRFRAEVGSGTYIRSLARELGEALGALGAGDGKARRVLLVAPAGDEELERSARNLPMVEVLLADSLNVVDLLRADVVLIEQPAIARMAEVYA